MADILSSKVNLCCAAALVFLLPIMLLFVLTRCWLCSTRFAAAKAIGRTALSRRAWALGAVRCKTYNKTKKRAMVGNYPTFFYQR